jgi:DNA modification methylase
VFAADQYNNNGDIVTCDITFDEMAPLIHDALADNADAYIMVNDKNQFDAQRAFLDAGFKFHNLLTWNKGTMTPNRWYMKNQEYVVYLWKGRARTINNPSSKQEAYVPLTKVTQHPTEKPVILMKHYIENSTEIGDTVLDCFMGTGATGVAAVDLGRKFTGIEIERKWFDVACERITRAHELIKQYGHIHTLIDDAPTPFNQSIMEV